MTFAAAVGEFVAAPPELPAPDRAAVTRSVFDVVGTLLAGRRSAHGAMVAEHVAETAAPGRCTVLGTAERVDPLSAALVNGTCAHADDYDDMGGYGHPSVALVPALLAAAELRDRPVSGAELIEAYAVGFELGAALCRLGGYDQYERCFHSTPVFGMLAAAAATARLLGVDAAGALCIAASRACGLGRNSGTMVKPLHAGLAAAGGLEATLLARAGISAMPDAFEARGGFCEAFFGRAIDLDRIQAGLGRPYTVATTIAIKKYPCCGSNQSALDAVDQLLREHALDAAQVEEVTVHDMGETSPVLRYPRPADGLEAKFSIEFTIAQRIRAGRLGLAEFAHVEEADGTIERVRPEVLARWDRRRAGKARGNPVTILTTDGRTLRAAVPRTELLGGPRHPLSWERLEEKFTANAARPLPAAIDLWRGLDGLDDLRPAIAAVAA
jgi:2-methylcitrate dehydratase PrpD